MMPYLRASLHDAPVEIYSGHKTICAVFSTDLLALSRDVFDTDVLSDLPGLTVVGQAPSLVHTHAVDVHAL
jgi:hypothetical protein